MSITRDLSGYRLGSNGKEPQDARRRVFAWQPRYRGPYGRQTGSFASPPFDGFAVFH
jgi:hypothetical protein